MSTALKKLALLLVVFAVVVVPAASTAPRQAVADVKPNIVLILTDDQDVESMRDMPKLQDRMVQGGTVFSHAYATTPRCCPSRASFLRGQYAHNHRILGNLPPEGGWKKFRSSGAERSTLATWLNQAGYTTGYVGKYMNGYGGKRTTAYIPPGWDRWWGWQGGYHEFGNYYKINSNGQRQTYDRRKLHDTDYFSQTAESFIRDNNGVRRPWFLVVAPNSPHSPAFAAERHSDMFRKAAMPKPPSFNEQDVSDKPNWIRLHKRLNRHQVSNLQETWRQRQRSLQSVDDLVGNVVATLQETGQSDDTYVVYASDNGHLLYRHRVKAKGAPYEESIGIPFVVRGPGVPHGETRGQLVGNIDFAPTVADWAGIRPPEFVDGRSFDPLLSTNPPEQWRDLLLIEMYKSHPFSGVRTSGAKAYFEYTNGNRELYNLQNDPYQLSSRHRARGYEELMEDLSGRMRALRSCAGQDSCAAAED